MSLYLDIEFLKRLNPPLLKSHGGNKFSYRCPVCGDSQKSKVKRRGFAEKHRTKDILHCYCHNCNFSGSLSYLLKQINQSLFQDYCKTRIEEKIKSKPIDWVAAVEETKRIVLKKELVLEESELLQNATKVPEALEYLLSRKVLKNLCPEIYYTKFFKTFINTYIGGKYANTQNDTPRIVFPILSRSRKLLGYQGRAISPSERLRYLTVKLEDSATLCYGMERLDENFPVYFVEGIFDALSIENGIAMLSSALNMTFVEENFKSDSVWIFDNERRNKEILCNYKAIANLDDYGIFFWPSQEFKDLNEMRMKYTRDEIMETVRENTVYGKLMKKIKLAAWKI